MPTLGQLIAEIRDDLARGSSYDPRIRRAVADAVQFYSSDLFGWNTTATALDVGTLSTYVALPTGYYELHSVIIRDGSDRYPLDERQYEWMDEHTGSEHDTGKPVYYAIERRQLRLWPTPDRSYSFSLIYQFDYGQVSVSASNSLSVPWTDEAKLLIRAHAMVDLLENHIEGDEALLKADRLRLREQQSYDRLKGRANREQTTGQIRGHL